MRKNCTYRKEKGEMSEKQINQKTESIFKVKNVLRALAFLGIIFVFCPSFLVSCSGQDIKVSAMTAIQGMTVYGERIVDPYPIMLITLLAPAEILFLLFKARADEKKTAAMIFAGTAVNFILWLVFRWVVKRAAEESYFDYQATVWFMINIVGLIAILVISAMILAGKLHLEMELISAASGGDTHEVLNQMSAAVNQMSSTVTQLAGNVATNMGTKIAREQAKKNAIGFCSKCGSPITYGSKFCTSCGTPVPESMIAEAEAAMEAQRRAAEEAQRRAAEEAQRRAAEEAQRRAAEEAQRKAAEEAQRRAAEEAQRRAAEEAQRRAAEEAQRRAAEEAQRRTIEGFGEASAEEVQRKAAEEAARKVVEEAARKVAEETARKQTEQLESQGIKTAFFCQQCGAKLSPNARFCEFCGAKVK